MDKKIVTIAMTIFMFSICIIAAITLSIIMSNKNSDIIASRTGSATLSLGDENDEMVVRGSALISSIVGIGDIENRIPSVKESVYGYRTEVGTTQMIYNFNYGAVISPDEIIKRLDPDSLYTIRYVVDNIDKAKIAIEIDNYTPIGE